jgi:hypothetical protein
MVYQGFSQDYETEADDTGWNYLVAANIDPRGMIRAFQKLEAYRKSKVGLRPSRRKALQGHPATEKRIARLENKWTKARAQIRFSYPGAREVESHECGQELNQPSFFAGVVEESENAHGDGQQINAEQRPHGLEGHGQKKRVRVMGPERNRSGAPRNQVAKLADSEYPSNRTTVTEYFSGTFNIAGITIRGLAARTESFIATTSNAIGK